MRHWQMPDGRILSACAGLGDAWIIGIRNPATNAVRRYRGLGVYRSIHEAQEALDNKAAFINATRGPKHQWREVQES